jgi:hypothetical protein
MRSSSASCVPASFSPTAACWPLVSTSAAPSVRSTRRLVAAPLMEQRLRRKRGGGGAEGSGGGAAAAAASG